MIMKDNILKFNLLRGLVVKNYINLIKTFFNQNIFSVYYTLYRSGTSVRIFAYFSEAIHSAKLLVY